MSVAAILLSIQQKNSDLNHYEQQQIWYANKHDATSAKVTKYAKYEEKWEKAYDDCFDAEEGKEKKINGETYESGNDTRARQYADAKVKERDEEVYLDLCDEDMEYDSMQEMYNTLCEEIRAELDSEKQLLSTEAQDTHQIGQ